MSSVHPCLRSPKISLDAPVNLKEFGQIPLDLVCLDSKQIAKCWPKIPLDFISLVMFFGVYYCIRAHLRDFILSNAANLISAALELERHNPTLTSLISVVPWEP